MVFDGVHPVLLRMSRYVTVITARVVYRYKMAYHGDKFLHIRAVSVVNNRDDTLHYEIEEEIQSRTFLINSVQLVVEGRSCYYFKGLIRIQREQMCFELYGVYVSSVADLSRTKINVLRLCQNATDRNRT